MKPSVGPIQAVNDFVVKFANVNGSGSASAGPDCRKHASATKPVPLAA